ncbi:MAG: response regulator [Thermoanaerobaculia bacterium]|nr:response regulator [Thermoanaerobaculia bacterium]
MNSRELRLLLVEDSPDDAELIMAKLAFQTDYKVTVDHFDRLSTALDQMERQVPDAVLLDLLLPDSTGVESVTRLVERHPGLAIVVLTATDSVELALEAMRLGAQSYLVKSEVQGSLLVRTILFAIERAKVGKELRRAQFAIEHAVEMVVWIATDGSIQRANRAACCSLGYSLDELLDRTVHDIGLHVQTGSWTELWRSLRSEGSSAFESEVRSRDGRSLPVDVTVSHLDFGGEQFLCAFMRDTTERKELEARLRQSQKLEALSTLAAGIAHDFNNILSAMLGFAELALLEVPEGSAAAADLEELHGAGDRAKELVAQILTFSRQRERKWEPVDVTDVLEEALKMLRAGIPSTIEMRHRVASGCGQVLGDGTQIHQIVMNLCTNAFQAMKGSGGSLDIELEPVSRDQVPESLTERFPQGPVLRLTIRDTGVGMDAATVERIFEPFFTTKSASEGTGMGLATVHGIVTSHGGEIVVESQLGGGSAFHVFLPGIERRQTATKKKKETVARGLQEEILLVDDEPSIARMAKRLLELRGFRVTVRNDPCEALAAFREKPQAFDLVLTDETMPGLTGHEMIRRMHQIRDDLPVILTTGYHPDGFPSADEDRIDRILLKPYSADNLSRAIRDVLDARNDNSAPDEATGTTAGADSTGSGLVAMS